MKYIVVGGGISGLSAAYYLSRLHPNGKISLIEKKSRLGGKIRTEMCNGIELEYGPSKFRSRGAPAKALLELIVGLGLKDHIKPLTYGKDRYIYLNSQVQKLPGSFLDFFFGKFPYKKELMEKCMDEIFYKEEFARTDENLEDFLTKRFGKELTYNMFSAFTRAVTGAGLDVSTRSNFPDIWAHSDFGRRSCTLGLFKSASIHKLHPLMEHIDLSPKDKEFVSQMQESGSIYSLHSSTNVLIDALEHYLEEAENVDLYRGSYINYMKWSKSTKTMEFNFTTKYRAEPQKEFTISAPYVISACPAHEFSKLLRSSWKTEKRPRNQYDTSLACALEEVEYNRHVVINLVFDLNEVNFIGYGYVLPITNKSPIHGVLFKESEQNGKKIAILTAICGASEIEETVNVKYPKALGSQIVCEFIAKEVKEQLKMKDVQPIICRDYYYPESIPRYHYNYHQTIDWIELKSYTTYGQSVSYLGTSLRGLGVGGCVLASRNYALELASYNLAKEVYLNKIKELREKYPEQKILEDDIEENQKTYEDPEEDNSQGGEGILTFRKSVGQSEIYNLLRNLNNQKKLNDPRKL